MIVRPDLLMLRVGDPVKLPIPDDWQRDSMPAGSKGKVIAVAPQSITVAFDGPDKS